MSDVPPLEDYVAHYGVKGMHWGVRKATSSGGSGGSSAPPKKKRSPSKGNVPMSKVRRDQRTEKGKKALRVAAKTAGVVLYTAVVGSAVGAVGASALYQYLAPEGIDMFPSAGDFFLNRPVK